MTEQLTFDDLTTREAPPREDRAGAAAAVALDVMRSHLGYKSWRDAWSANVRGDDGDGDPRMVQGSANLLMFEALCADDPLDADSLFCYLAELGALFLAEEMLDAFRDAE